MAYSDYGGYAYRNGIRVEDRSDAVITPEMVNVGHPGVYPGFVAHFKGLSPEDFEKTRSASVNGHVVLGDGLVFVAMYKQSYFSVYILSDGKFVEQNLLEIGVDLPAASIEEWEERRYFSGYSAATNDCGEVRFEVAGHIINAVFEESDNHYQYVKLTQPDGTIWTGFSGYGVGEGLEDCGYGYSTENQVSRLAEIFA